VQQPPASASSSASSSAAATTESDDMDVDQEDQDHDDRDHGGFEPVLRKDMTHDKAMELRKISSVCFSRHIQEYEPSGCIILPLGFKCNVVTPAAIHVHPPSLLDA
jgi:hypothetical protein